MTTIVPFLPEKVRNAQRGLLSAQTDLTGDGRR